MPCLFLSTNLTHPGDPASRSRRILAAYMIGSCTYILCPAAALRSIGPPDSLYTVGGCARCLLFDVYGEGGGQMLAVVTVGLYARGPRICEFHVEGGDWVGGSTG